MLSKRARSLFMWLIPDSEWLPGWPDCSDETLLKEAKERGLLEVSFLSKQPNVGKATIADIRMATAAAGIKWPERHMVGDKALLEYRARLSKEDRRSFDYETLRQTIEKEQDQVKRMPWAKLREAASAFDEGRASLSTLAVGFGVSEIVAERIVSIGRSV